MNVRTIATGIHQARCPFARASAISRAPGTSDSAVHTSAARVCMPPEDRGYFRVTKSGFPDTAATILRGPRAAAASAPDVVLE
jgi:hypothetical protein